jgi:ferredoxin
MKNLFSFILVFAISSNAVLAHADKGEHRGKSTLPSPSNARWKHECGSCHMAFAPGLLPASSWRKMMETLDKHFGTDASLSTQENHEISAFLVGNAANRWRAPSAPLRITETSWFKHKHHEIAPTLWKRPAIKSPANCVACHAGADQGDFEEHGVRIPR